MSRPLRICWFGTWREEYSRNRILIEGLRRNGVEVVECHARLWGGIEDRVKLASGGAGPRFLLRALGAWASLAVRFFRTGPVDAVVLGYPGAFDAYLARPLCRLRRKPLVLDAFMSTWLIAWERGLTARAPRTAKLLHALERGGLARADLILQDTAEYREWMGREFGVPAEKVRLVPTGADSALFRPRPAPAPDAIFRVLYAGTFIPNHGVPDMARAAVLLKDEADIRFTFIGEGPDRPEAEAIVKAGGGTNAAFEGWMGQEELAGRMAAADLSLGAFGTTPQSLMTVQNKIYEALAMGKPVLSGDGPAVRSTLTHGEHLWLCPRKDPAALADAIRRLKADPALRARLSQQGRARFLEIGSVEAVGAVLKRHLEELLA